MHWTYFLVPEIKSRNGRLGFGEETCTAERSNEALCAAVRRSFVMDEGAERGCVSDARVYALIARMWPKES